MCLPMLVLVIDMNLLVITTNSSMSRLDCSPDSSWVSVTDDNFLDPHFRAIIFPRATLRPVCVIYGIIVRAHEAGLTRFRGLASRYEIQQSAPLTSAHHHIREFPLVSKTDTESLPQSVMSFDAMQVFRDLIAFRCKSDYRTIVTIKLCTIANKVSIKNLMISIC